jgi:hypothetical protein
VLGGRGGEVDVDAVLALLLLGYRDERQRLGNGIG